MTKTIAPRSGTAFHLETGQVLKVIDPEGTQGWVSASLLSPDRGVIVVGAGLAALRAGPDDSAKLRWNAQAGVIGKLLSCDLGWCKIDVGGRVGWVREERLWGAGAP